MNCKVCRNGSLYDVFQEMNLKYAVTADAAMEFSAELVKRKDARLPLDVVFDMLYRDCVSCSRRQERHDNIIILFSQ